MPLPLSPADSAMQRAMLARMMAFPVIFIAAVTPGRCREGAHRAVCGAGDDRSARLLERAAAVGPLAPAIAVAVCVAVEVEQGHRARRVVVAVLALELRVVAARERRDHRLRRPPPIRDLIDPVGGGVRERLPAPRTRWSCLIMTSPRSRSCLSSGLEE